MPDPIFDEVVTSGQRAKLKNLCTTGFARGAVIYNERKVGSKYRVKIFVDEFARGQSRTYAGDIAKQARQIAGVNAPKASELFSIDRPLSERTPLFDQVVTQNQRNKISRLCKDEARGDTVVYTEEPAANGYHVKIYLGSNGDTAAAGRIIARARAIAREK